MSIHIEVGGNVQGHAGVEHDHGGVQDPREQPEHVAEWRRLERPHSHHRLLAHAILNAKLHHPNFAPSGVRGIQAVLPGEALRTAVDASAAIG